MRNPPRSAPSSSAGRTGLDVGPTPAYYEVDPRGRRIESGAATAPGADLVRLSSVLDVAALVGVGAHLTMASNGVPMLVLLGVFAAPAVPLVLLYASCASGMDDMTLRVRRIVGLVVPGLVLGAAAAGGRIAELLGASLLVQVPMLTMPFGAFAAHRALGLTARARNDAANTRRAVRRATGHMGGSTTRRDDVWEPRDGGPSAGRRRRSAFGVVVLVAGFVLMATGAIEATRRVWWFGVLWMAAGVLCMARSNDLDGPSSDRRLRRMDRGNPAIWVFAPIGALVAAARAIWILTLGS